MIPPGARPPSHRSPTDSPTAPLIVVGLAGAHPLLIPATGRQGAITVGCSGHRSSEACVG
jgi:hypothetical protein